MTTSIIKFVGEDLEISIQDRTDPVFLLYLSEIERAELYNGEGLLWYKHLKDNYGIRFGDKEVETRMENILISNKKKGLGK